MEEKPIPEIKPLTEKKRKIISFKVDRLFLQKFESYQLRTGKTNQSQAIRELMEKGMQ